MAEQEVLEESQAKSGNEWDKAIWVTSALFIPVFQTTQACRVEMRCEQVMSPAVCSDVFALNSESASMHVEHTVIIRSTGYTYIGFCVLCQHEVATWNGCEVWGWTWGTWRYEGVIQSLQKDVSTKGKINLRRRAGNERTGVTVSIPTPYCLLWFWKCPLSFVSSPIVATQRHAASKG